MAYLKHHQQSETILYEMVTVHTHATEPLAKPKRYTAQNVITFGELRIWRIMVYAD